MPNCPERWRAGLLALACLTSSACYQHTRRDAPAAPPRSEDDLVEIPGATFTQGDRNGDPDEYPERTVTVSTFRIERTEVSNAEYKACVEAKGCDPNAYRDNADLAADDHPVIGVSYFDAQRYCKWRGRRLPTEAEWEHAARGTDLRKWPWAGAFDAKRANTNDVPGQTTTTQPVTAHPEGASPYGVLNMAGNAAEWVADYYDPTYYRTSSVSQDPQGPDSGQERVVRGGSYTDTRHLTRVSVRHGKIPSEVSTAIGFRCAK